jgi:hypothetical protein
VALGNLNQCYFRTIEKSSKQLGNNYLKSIRENVEEIRKEGFHDNLKVYLVAKAQKDEITSLPPNYTVLLM